MKLRQSQATKLSLSTTLRSWLPILQADIESLDEVLEPFARENPFISIKSGYEKSYQTSKKREYQNSIEALNFYEKSLYDTLYEQINPPLFPTEKSRSVAYEIIENINEEGYFEGDIKKIAKKFDTDENSVEKIRVRFAYLEPVGVGAKDLKESFLFQLDEFELDEGVYKTTKKLIYNLENIGDFYDEVSFEEALTIIKKFKNPPALEYFSTSKQIIPDIYIDEKEGEFEIHINNSYYPEIVLDIEGVDKKEEFIKDKVKSAKDLVDALEMRKATLYKIGLMILEYQYDYFKGGSIKPMKLKDLAYELDRNPSTISRAVANKYLSCSRGVVPLKSFFSTAIDEDTSSSSIKEFIQDVVKNEDRKKPLSDAKIAKMVEVKFGTKIVRRTVTKYRKQLNIAGSSERKKLYLLK